MVIAQIASGLGNQMFQYAAARRVAAVNGVPLMLDVRGFQHDHLRSYQLNAFKITAVLASERELRRSDLLRPHLLRNRIWKRMTPWVPAYKRYFFRERTFCFDPDFDRLQGDVYLAGQWQSEKYFRSIVDVIKREFTLRHELEAENQVIADMIGICDAVSIHVRRGDLMSDPVAKARGGLCSLEYYARAVEWITQRVKQPHFFVFSDDPEWCVLNLPISHPANYVHHNGPESGPEDLRLMSLCKHHIIANSTFSWWGAWLGHNPAKIIVAPEQWFSTACYDTRDLLPPDWVRL